MLFGHQKFRITITRLYTNFIVKEIHCKKDFSKEQVKFRLVAYNPSTCKIRALGEFKLCKAKIKGVCSPESLQHDKLVETMHVLPQGKPENLLQNWTSKTNLKTPTLEIGATNPAMDRLK